MTRWVRNRPTKGEDAAAGLAAAGVGLAVGLTVFYVSRLFFSREPLVPELAPGEKHQVADRLDQKLLGPEG